MDILSLIVGVVLGYLIGKKEEVVVVNTHTFLSTLEIAEQPGWDDTLDIPTFQRLNKKEETLAKCIVLYKDGDKEPKEGKRLTDNLARGLVGGEQDWRYCSKDDFYRWGFGK